MMESVNKSGGCVEMQRYFVPSAQWGEQVVALEGDDARHLAAVMRAKPGDCFIACDGKGLDVRAKIVTVDKESVKADIIERLPSAAEMTWRVTVAQSLPKGDKLEIVIQKGTEAGAAVFQPFLSHRTIVQYDERKEAKRLERWRRIAKEAAEQSHRSVIPEVNAVHSWKALLKQFGEYELVLFCYEEEGRSGNGLRALLSAYREQSVSLSPRILIVIGPEGGFTSQEAEAAVASGARLIGLGRRILRTETAALYALACLAYESGELGGI
jgi:16S rRNA (uracil1498-N3)-methyltransferase